MAEKEKLQKLPDSLVPETTREDLQKLYININKAVQQSSEVTVTSDLSMDKAGHFIKGFKDLTKAIESIRKEIVTPLNAQVKVVNEFFKNLKIRYEKEEQRLVDESNFHLKKKRQLEEERKAQEQKELEDSILNEAEIFNDESVIDEIPDIQFKKEKVSETTQNLQTQRVKRWKVTDEEKIPRKYLTINEKLVDEVRKKHDFEDKSPIAGIDFYFDEVIKVKGK